LWKGRKDAHGVHCLVAWDRVCMPEELGGLCILNLRKMNLVLRVRWLWLSRVKASQSWKEFDIQDPPMVTETFKAATSSVVGDGSTTFFWLDNRLPDGCLKDLAPHLFSLMLKRISRVKLVKDALDGGWLDDIPLTSMHLRLRSCWRSRTAWRELLSPRVWQMCSGGTRGQGNLLREVLLSRHVPWKHGHGGRATGLEVPCSGQVSVLSLAGAA
jgi:hypothetical protein